MVGLSFCDFVGTREEKAKMAEYRKKEWPRRYKVTRKAGMILLCQVSWQKLIETLLTCFSTFGDSICRMVPIYGIWPFRSGRKEDALLSPEKLLCFYGQWAILRKPKFMLLQGRSTVDITGWRLSGTCSRIW